MQALLKLVRTFVGKIVALLGAVAVIAAFCALATDDSARSRLLHFMWIFSAGILLIATGSLLMKRNKN